MTTILITVKTIVARAGAGSGSVLTANSATGCQFPCQCGTGTEFGDVPSSIALAAGVMAARGRGVLRKVPLDGGGGGGNALR